jgi:hypothetical protein
VAIPADTDISVIVQGPVLGSPASPAAEQFTRRTIESVLTVLPGAEVILSTWTGSDVSGLRAHRIVESDDPGAAQLFGTTQSNNVNRQIVSSREGVRASSRPFVLKVRSDALMVHDGFRRLTGRVF